MTAYLLLKQLRALGVTVTADGGNIVVKPKAKLSAELVSYIRSCKRELLHVLAGDYAQAALALVLREASGEQRDELARLFDERLAACEQGGMDYGNACRVAYRQLARAMVSEGANA